MQRNETLTENLKAADPLKKFDRINVIGKKDEPGHSSNNQGPS